MLYLLILIPVIVLGNLFYKRYVPVQNVPCVSIDSESSGKNVVLLDVRDYHEAAKEPVKETYNLPAAYLKRHYRVIENRDIVIIASDLLSKNISTRFLRRKGFRVVGYALTESTQSQSLKCFGTKEGAMDGI